LTTAAVETGRILEAGGTGGHVNKCFDVDKPLAPGPAGTLEGERKPVARAS
jgi:hypothetical protein